MNLILAKDASEQCLNRFFEQNPEIDKQALLETGYVIEINSDIAGCFILESMEDGLYWLKQLYITQSEATALPLVLETILALAKKHSKKKVYVNSHQPMVDIILESLQFSPQEQDVFVNNKEVNKGKWWFYQVS